MASAKCKVCSNKVGVVEKDGKKQLKGHMRRAGNKTEVCPGSDAVVK